MIISNRLSDAGFETEYGIAIYLQKPQKRVLSIDAFHDREYRGNYFLSLPYSVFRIPYIKNVNGIKKYFGDTAFAFTENENLNKFFRPALPNCFKGLKICCDKPPGSYQCLEDFCKETVNLFWQSKFLKDYASGMYYTSVCPFTHQYKYSSLLSNYDKWQEKTKNEPEWIPTAEEMLECYVEKEDFFGTVGFKVSYPEL